MKSSGIALGHRYEEREFLINLIDSPGHVDFASEVSAAVRLCDGAIVVVDVVEGVCPQTRSSLSMAYTEGLKPVLVLNKLDRLITEMQLSPLDAYVYLTQILEQVNAVMGELFASDLMEREDKEELKNHGTENSAIGDDWQSALEEVDDSNLYFSPEQGNVLFASAVDGWAFGVGEFARIFAKKMGFSERVLLKTLWGDYYLNLRAKKIMKGATEKAKKPLFVSLILENLWAVYDTILVHKDRDKIIGMTEKMNIQLTTRDLRLTDAKAQLKAICSQWLPLAEACLNVVCEKIPSPMALNEEKIERLMSGNTDFSSFPPETKELKAAFLACDPSEEVPTIAFVSKLFSVEKKSLPENRTKPLTQEELEERRERARLRHAKKLSMEPAEEGGPHGSQGNEAKSMESEIKEEEPKEMDEIEENVLVAFARVYSGTVRQGQDLFVLGPKHDPRIVLEKQKNGELPEPPSSLRDLAPGCHITRVKISKLYILMGRELETIDSVPAGNVFGIGGLQDHVLKTATISSCLACPAFSELTALVVPILRVALEPKHSGDLQKLIAGLKLLNQADACAVMHIQETGEVVLNTAGEVHLERCLEDLKLHYAKVDINVSEPIVSFRETVVPPSKVDMTNEAIEKKTEESSIETWTANRQCCFEIDAKPLPEKVTKLLEASSNLIKQLDLHWERCGSREMKNFEKNNEHRAETSESGPEDDSMTDKTRKSVCHFRNEMKEAFKEADWPDVVDKIWSFGPRKCGSNILVNNTDYQRNSVWERPYKSNDPRAVYDSSIINGFQLATLAGPLCEEPMMGVCFILNRWQIFESNSDNPVQSHATHLGGQLMSACKEACRKALNQRRPRLVTPMYSCSVLVNSDVLGKLYAVFGRRQGRVIAAESALGFGGHFRVLATLPVPESFQLARELRTQTSGLATPQLVFSHWEVIEQDPYWVPSTEEEYLHFGEKADSENRAKKYMDAVRRRKGLPVDSQLVTHAEKQRTLSKNK
ncbi:elongation factor-like GTPase 1 isoform X2 [Venturia canescens]|nr:elongation factor-like GTPase 1 isoform X2 [Venturia canescens]